jgi:hypothetical protein
MNNIQQNILNTIKKRYLLLLLICLLVSAISAYFIPAMVGSISEQEINQQLNSMGTDFVSFNQIAASLIYVFRFFAISTALLIVAYIVKNDIDKRLFRWGSLRDWKFFIFISAIIPLEMYIFQGFATADFLSGFFLTIIYCIITIIAATILLPQYNNQNI